MAVDDLKEFFFSGGGVGDTIYSTVAAVFSFNPLEAERSGVLLDSAFFCKTYERT